MRGEGLRRDQRAVLACIAGRQGGGQHDAGQLHLELDAAVLVEIPVDGVFVVVRREDERDDQPTAAAGLSGAEVAVVMLPQQASVLLMQAYRLSDGVRLAVPVGQIDVEVADLAETVAAELE